MIRIDTADGVSRLQRRQALRLGFFSLAALATTELLGAFAPFFRVTRTAGFGTRVVLNETKDQILARFAETDDDPILVTAGRFFLLHPPGGIVAAYRKCTHLGCAVPFSRAEDRFHCGCHGSIFDKRTAVVIRDPAPKPLQLFHMKEEDGRLVVDTNPLNVIDRPGNRWDPAVIEVRD